MAFKADLSGLKHFMETVETYGRLLKDFHKVMEQICKAAQEFAESKYTEHGHSSTSVTVEYANNGTTATIYAKGTAVAFFEFGTGEYARGTYEGNLPTSGVPITGSWEYYYEPSETNSKRTVNGIKGWFWGNSFVKGNPAEAEMWETSQYIRQQAHKIIQAYFKAESGAV